MDYDISPEEPEEVVIDSAGFADVGGRRCERGNASLEMLLVLPVLVLLVVFVLWAGRGGRAGLVTDLAAGEAATVAALYSDDPTDSAQRERIVEQVLSARPGLDYLCIDGARGRDYNDDDPNDDGGFVDEQWVTFEPELPGHSPGVGVIGVSLECVTDGAVGPTRHLFPTVSFSGHATEVVAVDPRPLLSVVQASGNEGNIDVQTGLADMNTLEFLFQLDLPATQDVTINYYTRLDQTPGVVPATIMDDYTAVPESPVSFVMIERGELSATVEIAITADNLYELDETLELVWQFVPSEDPCAANVPSLHPSVNRLSDDSSLHPLGHTEACTPENPDYWKAVSVGTINNINNDDDPPVMTVTSPTASEDAGQMTFTVSLNAPTAVPVSFKYQTVDGTGLDAAMSGDDYTPRPLTDETIGPDQTNPPIEPIHVRIVDNFIAEDDEHFFLEITDVDLHATAPDPLRGKGTITDDEPTISIVGRTGTTGFAGKDEEGESIYFDVTATNVVAGPGVTVTFTVTPGTATPGEDYTVATPSSLTFTTDVTQIITVDTLDDDIDEADEETFTVELSLPPGSNNARILGDASITGVIVDNDLTPELHFARTVEVTEGQPPEDLDFNLLGRSSADVEVGFRAEPTGMGPGHATTADYSVNTMSPLRITAGTGGPSSINIGANQDPYVEQDESFELKVTHAHNAGLPDPLMFPQPVIVTIKNASPRLFSVADPLDVNEGEKLIFTISLDPVIPMGSDSVTVNYTLSAPTSGGATAPDDYSHNGTSVTFDPGDASKEVVVDTVFDLDYPEGDETLHLTIDTDQLPVVGFGTSKEIGVGKILDVKPPELSVSDPRAEEGADLDFFFTLDIDAVFDVTFNVCTYALRATAGLSANQNADYSNTIEDPNCAERTIAKGLKTTHQSVETFSDFVLEPDENLQMRVKNLENATLSTDNEIGVGTIEEDLALTVDVADATAVAGDTAGFLVKLNIAAPETINLHYTTRNGDALSGPDGSGDYKFTASTASNPPNFLVFKQSDDEKIISVQTWIDGDDHNESFFLDIWFDDPSQGTVRKGTGEGVITPIQTPTFSIQRTAYAQEGDTITVNVSRDGELSQRSSVRYRTVDLTTHERPATGGGPHCTSCDYYTTGGTLDFDEGQDSQSFTVQTREDSVSIGERPFEQFKAELFEPDNGTLLQATGILTIGERCVNPNALSALPPVVTGIDSTVDEGDGMILVTFEINPPLCSLLYTQFVEDNDIGSATVNEDFRAGLGGGTSVFEWDRQKSLGARGRHRRIRRDNSDRVRELGKREPGVFERTRSPRRVFGDSNCHNRRQRRPAERVDIEHDRWRRLDGKVRATP